MSKVPVPIDCLVSMAKYMDDEFPVKASIIRDVSAELASLRSENARLQKAADEARNLMLVAATLKEEKYSYMTTVARDWLAANPKEKGK